MTGLVMEIPRKIVVKQRELQLDKSTQVALAEYLRDRWPSNTAKMAARAFDLSLDRAKSAVGYSASLTTYDQIKKVGLWPVIFAVEARVIGQTVDQHLIEVREQHETNAGRIAALLGDWGAVASPRLPDPTDSDFTLDQRSQPERRRVG